TSPQTVSIKVLSGQTTAAATPNTSTSPCVATNGSPCAVQNLGQNIHFVSYTTTGNISFLDLRIEGSNDGVTFFPISDDAVDVVTSSGVLYAVGYYPVVRVNLLAVLGGGSVTANYTGTSGSSSPPTGNTYTTGLQIRKAILTGVSMGTNKTASAIRPYNTSAGLLFVLSTTGQTFTPGRT